MDNAREYVWQSASWPDLYWQNDTLIEQLGQTRLAQGRLLSKINALGLDLSLEARAVMLTEETVKTAAIEGEHLDRDSVRSSVAHRLGLPTAGLPQPSRHIDGLVDVLLDAAAFYDKQLTTERIKGWQAALFPTGFSGIYRVKAGEWRGSGPMRVISGPVGREKVHFEAPPHDRLENEMTGFLSWWHQGRGNIEGLLRAGVAHFRFVTVHPFEDGNGRIARALTDMALAQDEKQAERFYSFSRQIMSERNDYYAALEQCQKGKGDITPWLLWFLGCLERAIEHSGDLIAGVLAKAEFRRKFAHIPLNQNQEKIINRMLDAEPNGFEGGMNTRKYVSIARVSRSTAYRDIADLVDKGIFIPNPGKGRNISYRLV